MEQRTPMVREDIDGGVDRSARVPLPESSRGALPLCRRIKDDLARKIRSGLWRVDEEIPSEAELCQQYRVSRGTIRQALAELVQQALIYRRQGRGSFVQRPKLEGSVLGSYRLYMSQIPLDARSQVLHCRRRVASKEICKVLALTNREDVYEVQRIRFVNGVPISLQVSYLPARLCPELEGVDLSKQALYAILESKYGVIFLRAEEFIEPVLADERVARHLHIAQKSPVFLVERTSYMADDRIGEFRRGHMRGDLYRYRIDLR
jgi:DNA-binding GntR family transcriptional regulator